MSESLLGIAAIITAFAAIIPASVAAYNSVQAKKEAQQAKERAAEASLVAKAAADETVRQLSTITLNVDGRMSQLLNEVRANATLRGHAEGEEAERARQTPSAENG